MSTTTRWFVASILFGLIAEAPKSQELLVNLDPAHELRLITYNWGALQRFFYLAARYRVVATNGGLLLRDDPITITPFHDVEQFVITPSRACRNENSIAWTGLIRLDPSIEEAIADRIAAEPELRALGITPKYGAPITLLRWDVGPSGIASLSRGTRPLRSADCEDIQQDDALSDDGDRAASGVRREASSEVASHRGFRELRDDEFSSISTGAFQIPGSQRYMLEPLPYTPKYSLVIEFDEQKYFAMIAMQGGSSIDRLSEEEKARARDVQAQMIALSQMDEKKPILADVE